MHNFLIITARVLMDVIIAATITYLLFLILYAEAGFDVLAVSFFVGLVMAGVRRV